MKRTHTLLAAALFLLLLPLHAETGADTKKKPVSGTTAAKSALTLKLESLGFYVYPQPVPLPEVVFPALAADRAQFDSRKIAGEVVLLNFWATWCPPCRSEMPSLEKLSGQMAGLPFRLAAVSVGELRKTVGTFVKSSAYTFPIYLDESGRSGSAFTSHGIPSTYIVNKNSRVIAVMIGAHDYDNPEIVAVLKELAAQ